MGCKTVQSGSYVQSDWGEPAACRISVDIFMLSLVKTSNLIFLW